MQQGLTLALDRQRLKARPQPRGFTKKARQDLLIKERISGRTAGWARRRAAENGLRDKGIDGEP